MTGRHRCESRFILIICNAYVARLENKYLLCIIRIIIKLSVCLAKFFEELIQNVYKLNIHKPKNLNLIVNICIFYNERMLSFDHF